MFLLIRLVLALDLCLICAEELIPAAHDLLPIGGSHVVQAGVALIGAFVVAELAEVCAKALRNARKLFKKRAAN